MPVHLNVSQLLLPKIVAITLKSFGIVFLNLIGLGHYQD